MFTYEIAGTTHTFEAPNAPCIECSEYLDELVVMYPTPKEVRSVSTGTVCESCYALNSGIDSSYWEDQEDTLAHCEEALAQWEDVVIDTGEDPCAHFGSSCIICTTPLYAGNIYDAIVTEFYR